MMSPAISVRGLSKHYRIGTAAERHDTLRELLTHSLSAPARNLRRLRRADHGESAEDTLWALRDVTLDVAHGEVLGIIGRNGAGKSTLLKVLARITEPSAGQVIIRGRLGALLEVGTGFHPELTGRENVFLNGSILGMDRAYIAKRFDEIVEFAGVHRFIDTPVKRYSSGMYLRLAFAVAAHLEPDILVVDEVLAVGDAEFQRKCLGKMSDVATHGRTVLFVSHSMGAVSKLCSRVLLLEQGRVAALDSAHSVIRRYLAAGIVAEGERHWNPTDAPGAPDAALRRVAVRDSAGVLATTIDMAADFDIEIDYEVRIPFPELNVALLLTTDSGETVLHSTLNLANEDGRTPHESGSHRALCRVPGGLLNAGHYWISVIADVPFQRIVWNADHVLRFEIELTSGRMARYPAGAYRGTLNPLAVAWARSSMARSPSDGTQRNDHA